MSVTLLSTMSLADKVVPVLLSLCLWNCWGRDCAGVPFWPDDWPRSKNLLAWLLLVGNASDAWPYPPESLLLNSLGSPFLGFFDEPDHHDEFNLCLGL